MKIVIGLDGSDHSLKARDLVAGLRWPADSTVHLVGAYQAPIDWSGGFGTSMAWVGDIEDALRDELDEQLTGMAEPLTAAGLRAEHSVGLGRPADVILRAARDVGADLVVVGSRGLGRVRSMLLGSVAAEVTSHASCPVLVARAPNVDHLLVATDGSPGSDEIVDRLGCWGAFAGLPADVVSVAVPDSPAFELMVGLSTLGDERLEAQRAEVKAQAETASREMADRLVEVGIRAEAHPRRGDPAAEIVAHAEEVGADLVVMGSRGLTGLDRMFLGSVARNVLTHAHCSVLIVRKEA